MWVVSNPMILVAKTMSLTLPFILGAQRLHTGGFISSILSNSILSLWPRAVSLVFIVYAFKGSRRLRQNGKLRIPQKTMEGSSSFGAQRLHWLT